MTGTESGQTQSQAQVRYVKTKKKVQTTRNSRIQVPDLMVLWELPLEYMVQKVEREGDTVMIMLKIIKEGGHEPSKKHEVVINE
jgi:hypothetical protein